ncbi:hypothetical protein [Candidatus Poriferisodalis sp.]|uniref:hypothetical protein n=1 Tax=Candidatus Poriferisodalis sp. TaxID=3101277 RepID=UPI003B013DEB
MDMPKVRVSLPKPLCAEVKARRLPVSELLEKAVRKEVQRQDLIALAKADAAELLAELGEPDPETVAWAEDLARQLARRDEPAAR